jgi:glucokinase
MTSSTTGEHTVTVSTDPTPHRQPVSDQTHVYVVVDLGGTQTRTAVFDVGGQMLMRRSIATPRTGPSEVVAAVLDEIRSAMAQQAAPVIAIGVSALGPVDPSAGLIRSAPTLPGFDNVPIGPRLRDALTLPVHVHNDANAAAIAEWQLGAGRGTRDFCYVTVSTGVGCGIISNRELVTGRAGNAGELGRIRIAAANGTTVQLEEISSGTAIAERARTLIDSGAATCLASNDPTDITAGTVAAAASAGDRIARDIYTTAATTLGVQLANLTRLVEPEIIALGGGVTLAGDVFWRPLQAALDESLDHDAIPAPRLVAAKLRGDAGLHGAAIALLNRYGQIDRLNTTSVGSDGAW